MKLIWTKSAEGELRRIFRHIRRDSVASAMRVRDALKHEPERPLTFQNLGRIGRVPGTRELPTTPLPYIIVYEVSGEMIAILTIRHGAQRYPAYPLPVTGNMS